MWDTARTILVALGIVVLLVAVLLRVLSRYLLRLVLRWHVSAGLPRGWRRALVRLLLGQRRGTFDFEESLPALPIPPLAGTIERYLASVRPLLGAAEHEAHQREVEDMAKRDGFWLQLALTGHAVNKRNWLRWLLLVVFLPHVADARAATSEWWLEYVFLRPRSPIALNSNWHIIGGRSTADPLLRCVAHLRILANLMLSLWSPVHQRQTPFLGGSPVPLSMSGLRCVFGVTRIAGEATDMVQIHSKSRHVAVLRHGHLYVFDLVSAAGKTVSEEQLLANVRYLWELPRARATSAHPSVDGPAGLAALTGDDRATWAANRSRYFSTGQNKLSLYAVESALFMVCMDDDSPATDSEMAASAFHGNGSNRWFDKSFNYIVCRNGRIGINCEHSPVDAPVFSHLFEALLMGEDQWMSSTETRQRALTLQPIVKRLQWNSTPALLSAVETARTSLLKMVNDSDLVVLEFAAYGRAFVKRTLRINIDGWVQMALQLAYYRNCNERVAMTYESCSTRMFADGRSECVRPLSMESLAFCQRMVDSNSTMEEKRRALRAAVAVHSTRAREAAIGQGVDRHLFGLLVMSIRKQMKSAQATLTKMLSAFPFELSTAQIPTRLAAPHFPWSERAAPAGGGHGAVTRTGLGVGYMLLNERLVFHVHSWRHSNSSRAFAELLERSLFEMCDLFVDK